MCSTFAVMQRISIHALREEGDSPDKVVVLNPEISIHALREEGDGDSALYAHLIFISIHALREEGDVCDTVQTVNQGSISIHALREEGDRGKAQCRARAEQFLSTPSARRATAKTEKNISAFVSL